MSNEAQNVELKSNRKQLVLSRTACTIWSLVILVLLNVSYFMGRVHNSDSKVLVCKNNMVNQKEYTAGGRYTLNPVLNEDGNLIQCSDTILEPELEYYDYRENSGN